MTHHPHDELLLSYAAGALPETTSILIATHLALCPACRKMVGHAECVGGMLVHDIEPAPMNAAALDAVLARLDDESRSAAAASPGDQTFPRPLRDYLPQGLDGLKWRAVGKGLRYALIRTDDGGRLGLLRGQPGTVTPHHGHGGDEVTLVLSGGYADAGGRYVRGDVQCADQDLAHQPVVHDDDACLCLVLTRGGIRLSNPLLRLIARFLPF